MSGSKSGSNSHCGGDRKILVDGITTRPQTKVTNGPVGTGAVSESRRVMPPGT
jgi:hypothetical protein